MVRLSKNHHPPPTCFVLTKWPLELLGGEPVHAAEAALKVVKLAGVYRRQEWLPSTPCVSSHRVHEEPHTGTACRMRP